jgi:hypothetical protein
MIFIQEGKFYGSLLTLILLWRSSYPAYVTSFFSWSAKRRSELFLYSENNGVIWDIAINRTSNPYDTMYIVGTFDTDARASQFQFCSVSEYDGVGFNKVCGNCSTYLSRNCVGWVSTEILWLVILQNNGVVYCTKPPTHLLSLTATQL